MLFSKACEYGIRAMLYLASQEDGQPVRVREIAEALKIPVPFLSKIVHSLSRNHLIHSQKGPGGGVTLAKPPSDITMLQVVEVIDGLDLFQACALGIPHCSDDFPCPLHEKWGTLRSEIHDMLANRTLDQVIDQLQERGWILVRD
ncbi:MAG: Rrf2 family transcriptional regulator [Candidatus Latescibacteria bacterium]|jgi:Rrf2 family transcriptional regulator, iron-sulfur cluster assembly transcription factor|nr:Rrf2 family transcriptional regulator [Candidatus Latescibacterota bacterium]MBT4141293.1 Rrf2 family transcriptional regulator [Candidatus Latescibacterota bacterium]